MIRGRLLAGAIVILATLWGAQASFGEETKLVFATLNPPQATMSTLRLHPWAEAINQRGAGIVHIDIRDGSAIANHANFYSRVLDDVVQIAFGSQSYIGGKFQRSEVVSLPFGAKSSADGSQAFWQLYASGVLDAEYDEIHPLVFFTFPQQALHFAKKLPSPTEVGGLKVITSSRVAAQVMSELGASPLSINAQDIYSALQRGMADGVMFPWTAMEVFKLTEVTTYHVDTFLGGAPAMVFMAKKKYQALPADVRKILDEMSGETASRKMGQTFDREGSEDLAKLKADPRRTVMELTATQNAEWREKVRPAVDVWLRETPDGAAVLAKYNEIMAKLEPDR